MIRKGLVRSATIAYESHPRDLRDEKAARGLRKKPRLGRTAEGRQSQDTAASLESVWGIISHPGWSSPSSTDLPNLEYEPVILELSHLIEAKAVSLAPSDPLSSYEPNPILNPDGEEEAEPPIPDPVAVELLQRPASMGLRDYLSHLAAVGMLDLEPLASDFLTRYEYARYSGQALDETQFRTLMSIFAEILRGMRALDVGIVDEARAEMEIAVSSERGDGDDGPGYQDADSINTTETVQRTPQLNTYSTPSSTSSTSSSSSSSSSTGTRSASQHATTQTAPSRPAPATRNPSSRSRRSPIHQQPSLSSLRRMKTDNTSSSGHSARSAGSVIRLKDASGPLDLPYAIYPDA